MQIINPSIGENCNFSFGISGAIPRTFLSRTSPNLFFRLFRGSDWYQIPSFSPALKKCKSL